MFGKEITDKDGKTTRDNSGLISNNTVKTISTLNRKSKQIYSIKFINWQIK